MVVAVAVVAVATVAMAVGSNFREHWHRFAAERTSSEAVAEEVEAILLRVPLIPDRIYSSIVQMWPPRYNQLLFDRRLDVADAAPLASNAVVTVRFFYPHRLQYLQSVRLECIAYQANV